MWSRSPPAVWCSPPPRAALTSTRRLWVKGKQRDLGTGVVPWTRGHAVVGLRLLLEPPHHARGARHVGHPRAASLQRALQPVHRAAPAGGRRVRRVGALRRRRTARRAAEASSRPRGAEPDLPVLDPHRHHSLARRRRGSLEHPVAPSGAPRQQPSVPRPQPCGDPHRLGPSVRHVPGASGPPTTR